MNKEKFYIVLKENGTLDIERDESGSIRKFTMREASAHCDQVVLEGKGEYTCYIFGGERVRPYEAKVGDYQMQSVEPLLTKAPVEAAP